MIGARQRGFTLIEAIVALTILATTLIALFSWLTSSVIALDRVRDNALRLEDQRSALAVLETINPLESPSGERRAGPLHIRWDATALIEPRMGITRANLPSAFDVALYDVEVRVRRDGGDEMRFRVRRAGWLLARPPEPEE